MSKKQKRVLWPTLVALMLVLAGLVGFGARARARLGAAGSAGTQPTGAMGQGKVPPGNIWLPKQKLDGLIVLQISRFGFEPAEIQRPMGHHLIYIVNRSGANELILRLDRVAGARLHEVRLPREKGGWRQEVDLLPGQYVISEANHPDWNCRITVA